MGIIAALLVGAGYLQLEANGDLPVPLWVVLSAHAAIALGTLSGGWRIVKTLGQRITALKPVGGFSAETAAACSLYLATFLGIPVSTTQTITGAIVGVGATRRLSAVRWGVAGRIVWAWVLTIPAAALIAAVTYAITVSPFARGRPRPGRRRRGRRPGRRRPPGGPPGDRGRAARRGRPSRSSPRSAEAGVRLAVLDVGSNTVHLVVVDGQARRHLHGGRPASGTRCGWPRPRSRR